MARASIRPWPFLRTRQCVFSHSYRGVGMSATSKSLVNQKLAFARFLLAQYQQIPASTEARLQKGAVLESALMHLACAYRHHLHELAENSRLKQVNRFSTEESVLQALAGDGRYDASLDALRELRVADGSWLKAMLQTHECLWQAPAPVAIKKAFHGPEGVSLIAVAEVQEDPLENLFEQVSRWSKALELLVNDYRQTFFES
jgi:hypothetical protein